MEKGPPSTLSWKVCLTVQWFWFQPHMQSVKSRVFLFSFPRRTKTPREKKIRKSRDCSVVSFARWSSNPTLPRGACHVLFFRRGQSLVSLPCGRIRLCRFQSAVFVPMVEMIKSPTWGLSSSYSVLPRPRPQICSPPRYCDTPKPKFVRVSY